MFTLVAADEYEKIPKMTCFPEQNERYDMMFTAKMACHNDKGCSAVVESPKRRGQQKKFGEHYSLTEREFSLCSYPLTLKATDDTILLRKRGNSRTIKDAKI